MATQITAHTILPLDLRDELARMDDPKLSLGSVDL